MNCPYCGDLVSYPKSQGGETSDCPYCDHEITLPPYVPKDRKNLKLFVVSLLGTLSAVALLGYIVFEVMKRLDFVAEMATGIAGILLTVVVGGLTVVTVLLWIVFPLFAYHYLGRIARATESSESLLQIISKKMDNR
jgi:uncharacterized paraquat-inducible protein A